MNPSILTRIISHNYLKFLEAKSSSNIAYLLSNHTFFYQILVLFLLLNATSQRLFAQNNVSFNASGLAGENIQNPTSLQFGPDNRLYVAQQNGSIYAYTIQKNGPNNYQVTSTEIINLVKEIPNHNDDGTLYTSKVERQVTGILVTGTQSNPILYVSSSDYRIGGGGTSGDLNLDTNSGTISKLFKSGSNWEKIDLVRGLPRSEENHSNNGLEIDLAANKLYVAMGGSTNAGAPSNNFAFITEYALAAAIISIDLNIIESLPVRGSGNNKYIYDLPTLNDPLREDINNPDYNVSLPGSPQTKDVNDPFGGNDGLNQAKIVPGGPVQIHSPGYRNVYDLVFTKTPGREGNLYTIDNGPNGGWGGFPENEGAFGNPLTTNATNNYVPGEPGSTSAGQNDAKVNNLDNLHLVSGPDLTPIYAGHPCPIRANPAGAGLYWFDNVTGTSHFSLSPTSDWPPVPLSHANPVEGDYRNPGVDDGALYTWPGSTNGLTEYNSSKFFGGEMLGDLLAASYDGEIYRIKLNSDGTAVQFAEILANGFGANPLDVVAQGTGKVFEGTIWVASYGANAITIFEPVAESSWALLASSDNSTPTARHENGYVEAGGKFYLIGGRGSRPLKIYDPVDNKWSTGASSPLNFHHFQAVEHQGLIYVMGAFIGSFPNETPVENIYIYNPSTNSWTTGPPIPTSRRRGSAGVVKYNNNLYMVGGIINGHTSGWVPWLDEFNPSTGTWTQLPDAPRARDHFQAVVANNKLYTVAGRQSGKLGTYEHMLAEVDIFDFSSNSWSTLPSSANLPTLRAGAAAAIFNNELLVIGGESTLAVAHNETQALDISTNTWRSLAPLNTGRHGTQAVVYNDKIYIAAGSGGQGSSPELNSQETFITFNTTCSGDNDNYTIDDDNDGYSNGDETDNLTNPCSAASIPNDHDKDLISDLNDPDDDNDGLMDTLDKFALDPHNGINNNFPIDYPFLNGVPGTGLFGLGFTGLMSNGSSNYNDLFNPAHPDLIMGGAVGLASLSANSGDAITNDQTNGFQFGVNVNQNYASFTIQSGLLGDPYFDGLPLNELSNQSLGIYIGTGDQDNYLKIVLAANNGSPGFQVVFESNGIIVQNNIHPIANILQSGEIDLFLEVNPQNGQIQPKYSINSNQDTVNLGAPIFASGPLLNVIQNNPAIAVGLISTSGTAPPFIATWDDIKVYSENLTADSRINAGNQGFIFNNEQWQTDQFADAGSSYTRNISIANTANDQLYHSERNGVTFNYEIPVSKPGTYIVKLHFAEIYHGVKNTNGIGARIFNVNIEGGQALLQNYDIIERAGATATAIVETFSNINVNDGNLTVAFTTINNRAKISGIEILSSSGTTNQTPVVISPGNQIFEEGQSVTLQIDASDPEGDQLTFSQIGLPTSLAIDSSTGLISGTIEANAGNYPVTVTVTDENNLSSQTSFNISINEVSSSYILHRINAGGTEHNFNEENWQADQYSTGGSSYTKAHAIEGTLNDKIYQSERYGTFDYQIPVPTGTYSLRLHFAELYFGAIKTGGIGSRIFNVSIENGQSTLQNYDIFQKAGGAKIAVIEHIQGISVSDGFLTISLSSVIDNPKISAIEVLSGESQSNLPPIVVNPGNREYPVSSQVSLQIEASDPESNPLIYSTTGLPAGLSINENTGLIQGEISASAGNYSVSVKATDQEGLFDQKSFTIIVTENSPGNVSLYAINAGGPAVTFDNLEWQMDQFAVGGATYAKSMSIEGTLNDKIYQTERYGTFSYELPVSNGEYLIKLHFAELVFGGVRSGGIGSRLFNVDIEGGQSHLTNYDIFESAGGAKIAIVEEFTEINVSDGSLSIAFMPVIENPKLSAIEVYAASSNTSLSDFAEAHFSKQEQDLFGDTQDKESYQLYPNPTSGEVTLETFSTSDKIINITLIDHVGRLNSLGRFKVQVGSNKFKLNVKDLNLPTGLHFLKIESKLHSPKIFKLYVED